MYDLETILSIEKNRSNKNEKFVGGENSPQVFSRLQFDFTFPDPSVIELSESAKEHLRRTPKFLKDWQAEDMRNNNAKDYYKNPVGDAIDYVKTIADKIVKSSEYPTQNYVYNVNYFYNSSPNIVSGLEDVHESANVLSYYAGSFKLHTDRLSNVVGVEVGEPPDPHYLTCSALGRSVLYITNQTDGIEDTRPVLGSFTSLFVADTITDLSSTIIDYPDLIESSISSSEGTDQDGNSVTIYTSNLSFQECSTIINDLNAISSFIGNRMAHDKRFWENSKKIHEEYSQFKVMNEEGESQKKIIKLIGTDKLKASINIADNPSPIKWDTQIDYFGNINYTPNTTFQITLNENSPLSVISDYIDYYANNEITITGPIDANGNVSYQLSLSNGAIDLYSANGIWSNTQSIIITNIANTPYIFSTVDVSDFDKTEIKYDFNPANTNIIASNSSITFNVSARGITTENGVEYGVIKIIPGVNLQTRITYETKTNVGILSPTSISMVYGSETEKLIINANNGPYRILSVDSIAPDYYTWANFSENPVTISTIENITPTSNSSDLTIYLINANTATLNVGDKALWYANVIPNITTPNNSIFKVTTEDGQERLITIGVYSSISIDDSSLYNETLSTNPDLIIANGQPFSINVSGGKPYTTVTYSGPDLSGSGYINANGTFGIYNADGITSNGYYTYTFSFPGTEHSRTITKAIFTS